MYPDPMEKQHVFERIVESGVVGILRGIEARKVDPVAEALVAGGVEAIEITADTPGAMEMIRDVSTSLGDEALLGAGTVLDPETARTALLAGADFVVTPTVSEAVIETCNRYGTVVAPGVMTPTEALTAYEAGADLCKLFPASTVGPGQVTAIRGPLEQIPLVPTGGVSTANAADFFEAGAVAVGVGSGLVDDDAVANEAYDRITETAAELIAIADDHR